MVESITSEQAARLLEQAATPAEAVKLLSQLGHGRPYYFYADHDGSQALELVRQDRLHEMWMLGPEARRIMMFAHLGWNPTFLARLSDDAIRVALSDEDQDVVVGVVWYIVYTSRAALYPEILQRSDMFRWSTVSLTCHPAFGQLDKRLAKALARQAFARVIAGTKVERELRFLLSEYAVKPFEAFGVRFAAPPGGRLPFEFLGHDEQSWLAKNHPAEVARVVGWHPAMDVSSADKALDILRRAGFGEVEYDIRGTASYAQILAFNRRVCSADDEVPADALLIKEGFGWEVEAAEIWPQYTTGGFFGSGSEEPGPEYDVSVAVEPRKWLYRSRSNRSAVAFERRQDNTWQFEGRVSLNCLRGLKEVGIEPTIFFGSAEIRLSTILEAASAAEATA